MSIGKMIAEVLQEIAEKEKRRGPEVLLSDAARESHRKHKEIIDRLWPEHERIRLEAKMNHNRIEEENERWSLEMKQLQPELLQGSGFEISEAGLHARVIYDHDDNESVPEVSDTSTPKWAKELIKDSKPN